MTVPTAKPWWRRIPIDVLALVVIAIVMTITHLRYIRTGMCFNDPSWYFHFGRKALHGAVPYRDYIFQVGPLPIYVDAGFQELFGERYVSSLYAGLLIKELRVMVMWLLVRRVASWPAAAALCVFCAIDPMFAFAHHWSTAYAQLFLTSAGLLLVLASTATGRRALIYIAAAGFLASLVVSARQSTAVIVGVVLAGVSGVMFLRKEAFTKQRLVALWGGFALGMALVFGALALAGALGPAIQQMFLDAPAKKNVHGVTAILDAISGGALVDWSFSWWAGFLYFLGLPVLVVIAMMRGLTRERELDARTIGVLAVPVLLVYGIATRDAMLLFFSDLPRTFLTVTTIVAVLFPDRARSWFGVEPLALVGLGALPLASDWALEMSYPGRGWGDAPSVLIGSLLVILASKRLAPALKTAVCVSLALVALIHFKLVVGDRNPLAKDEASDGTWRENRVRSTHPILRGLRINAARKQTVDWLTAQVPPGSTCFIYGNMPVLYDLLECRNPTRVDSTAADFITAQDGEAALAVMRANPPDFIIAHEKQWMSPPLTLDLGGELEKYDGLNPKASMAVHLGLRSLLEGYEQVGSLTDALGPEMAAQMTSSWDVVAATKIYKRRR